MFSFGFLALTKRMGEEDATRQAHRRDRAARLLPSPARCLSCVGESGLLWAFVSAWVGGGLGERWRRRGRVTCMRTPRAVVF